MTITQKLILQPRSEVNLSAEDIPDLGIGSGLPTPQVGARLRYEVHREFAPYIGAEWTRSFGDTRDFAEARRRSAEDTRVMAGIRALFKFLEKMMKIQIAAAVAVTGLLAACQPVAEQPQPKEAISVAEPAATATAPAVAPTEVASATAPTGQATSLGPKAAEPVKAAPAQERPSQTPNVSSSQTMPQSTPMTGHDMPGHDMSTMPDLTGMDHSPKPNSN